jgi:hypothetical protein
LDSQVRIRRFSKRFDQVAILSPRSIPRQSTKIAPSELRAGGLGEPAAASFSLREIRSGTKHSSRSIEDETAQATTVTHRWSHGSGFAALKIVAVHFTSAAQAAFFASTKNNNLAR